jgi:hypothetical protein
VEVVDSPVESLNICIRSVALISAEGLSIGLVEMIVCFPGSTIATIAACCGGWIGVRPEKL